MTPSDIPVGSPSIGLEVRGLSKSFIGPTGELMILKSADLTLHPGDSLAVTGPSGSGKSTLLYCLGTLDRPTTGEISIAGENPSSLDPNDLARFRNSKIGFVFQDHHLLPQLNVLENVLVPLLAGRGISTEDENRALKLLDRVGLKERIGHRPGQLSGGERQRVALCRALINQPLLLLADEPTGNLDPHSARDVGSLLLELNAEQKAILIVVTHSLELATRFPRRVELVDGSLVERGV